MERIQTLSAPEAPPGPGHPPEPGRVVDLGFMDARIKLLDVAAFLDRAERAGKDGDFRVEALKRALRAVAEDDPGRARRMLTLLSDPSEEPIPAATQKGACGVWEGGGG